MKKKLLILLTLMFFAPFIVKAEELKLNWQKSNEGNVWDEFYSFTSTEDGGYVAVGYITSTNIEGITYKGNTDAIIVKYDKDGNLLWQKSWGGNNEDKFNGVTLTENEGYVAVGYTRSTNIDGIINNGYDAIIVKYDKDGNMLWQKNWGGNSSTQFNSVKSTEDGGYVAVGKTYSTNMEGITIKGECDAIIVKYDKDGYVLWQKNYGGNDWDDFSSVTSTKDGGYVAVGYTRSTNIEGLTNKGDRDAVIVKYDKDGNLLWQKNYGGNDTDQFFSVTLTEDGGYVAVGYSTSTDIEGLTNKGRYDAIMIKYDKDGNVLWQKNYGGNDWDGFSSVTLTEDGGYVAVGYIESKNYDALIVKYDKDGNLLWQKSWGGNKDDKFNGVALTEDGGYVAVGYSCSTDIEGLTVNGYYNTLIVKYLIEYELQIGTLENGTTVVEQKGKNGIITPTPNEGYEVSEIVIKGKDGNILDLEVTKLEDGTYSFELNDDVTVEVLFKEKLENPKTGVKNITGFIFTIMLVLVSGLFIIKNYNKSYEI